MKTLQQIKDEYAKERGWLLAWKYQPNKSEKDYDEVCRRAQEEACKATLEKAAEAAKFSTTACGDQMTCGCMGRCDYPYYSIRKKSITNEENIVLL